MLEINVKREDLPNKGENFACVMEQKMNTID